MAKQKLEISKKEFQFVVDQLEKKQDFATAADLWTAVEATNWAKTQKPRPLTAAVAYARAKELGITTLTSTGKRGRTPSIVNKEEFQAIVTKLENEQVFSNIGELWVAVEATEWAMSQSPRPLKAASLYMKAKELGIVTRTLPGKKGIQKGQRIAHGTRKPRSEKMKNFTSSFEMMRVEVPARFHPLIESMEKGSMKAALKMKCLDCSNYQPSEIKNCGIVGCPLYPYRPYQGSRVEVTTEV